MYVSPYLYYIKVLFTKYKTGVLNYATLVQLLNQQPKICVNHENDSVVFSSVSQGRLPDVHTGRQQRHRGSVPEPQLPGGLWQGAPGAHVGPRGEVPRWRL